MARTIADLDGRANIDSKHALETVRYRVSEYKYWSL